MTISGEAAIEFVRAVANMEDVVVTTQLGDRCRCCGAFSPRFMGHVKTLRHKADCPWYNARQLLGIEAVTRCDV
jgi:hypothetical protein